MHKVQGVTKLRCPSKNKIINLEFDKQTVSHEGRERQREKRREIEREGVGEGYCQRLIT